MNLVRSIEAAGTSAQTEIVRSLSLLLRRLSRSFERRAKPVHLLVRRSELMYPISSELPTTYKSDASAPLEPPLDETEASRRVSSLKKLYDKTAWVWIVMIVCGLVFQGLRSANMSRRRAKLIGKPSPPTFWEAN